MSSIEHYTGQYETTRQFLPGVGLDWIEQKRRQGLSRFGEFGFPGPRDEDWRYTPLRPVTSKSFSLVESPVQEAPEFRKIPGLESHQVVFVDGHLVSQLPEEVGSGITITSLARALVDSPQRIEPFLGAACLANHGLTELNNALYQDGVVLLLEPGSRLEIPLELVFVSAQEGALVQPPGEPRYR